MRSALAIVAVLASCSYDAKFRDCQVSCGAQSSCPTGFACGAEGLCRTGGVETTSCGAVLDANPGDDAMTGGDAGSGGSGSTATPGLYVIDFEQNRVYVYPPDATGSATPTHTIAGSDTDLVNPIGVAVDHHGNIVVANLGGEVTVFPPDADGDAIPARVLSNPSGLREPTGVAVAGDDSIFVAYLGPIIAHYPPNASSSDRQVSPGSFGGEPYLTIDSAGDLVVADVSEVRTYAPTASGSDAPLSEFGLAQAQNALAVATNGNAIILTEDTGALQLFGADDIGSNVNPVRVLDPSALNHGAGGEFLATDGAVVSPTLYTGEAQQPVVFIIEAAGSGTALTGDVTAELDLPDGAEPGGIAVVRP
nr:hypothetical protein [Kofleriaceae bacterium]